MTSQAKGASLDISVGAMSRNAGRGNTRASNHNLFKGKNWNGGIAHVEQPLDRDGLIFIARTDLCLRRPNIKGHRQFSSLLSPERLSSGGAIRAMLDPRWAAQRGKGSPLVDPLYGFMSLMDNTILSCTGWPDDVVKVTPTPPNRVGASALMVEGQHENGKPFTLSMEHNNTEGGMVTQTYNVLTRYSQWLRRHEVARYDDNIHLDRLDWKSRIYRFVFDKTGTRVEHFTMTGEAFALSSSIGALMNHQTDSSINTGYETVSGNWQCGGYFHNDPIVIDEFNRTQVLHNPNMHDDIREQNYYRVGADEGVPSLTLAKGFMYMGYPRIHPLTLEFEIWIPNLLKNLIAEGDTLEDFKQAMRDKNDEDIFNGMSEYDQEEFSNLFN